MMSSSDSVNGDSSATQRPSRAVALLLIAGFVIFMLAPGVVELVRADSFRQAVAPVISVAFFGWLSWRVFVLFRDRHGERSVGYWHRTALGHAFFLALLTGLHGWDIAAGRFRGTSLIFTGIVAALLASALYQGKRAESATTEA